MNLASTEEIDLFASESNIAFGISCSNNENEKLNIEDILDLKMKYIIITRIDFFNFKNTVNYILKILMEHMIKIQKILKLIVVLILIFLINIINKWII